MSVLEPIDTSVYAEDAASDPLIIAELNAKVLHAMQAEVDRLVKGRIPVIGRIETVPDVNVFSICLVKGTIAKG